MTRVSLQALRTMLLRAVGAGADTTIRATPVPATLVRAIQAIMGLIAMAGIIDRLHYWSHLTFLL